jgi:hypothetical protein
MTDGNGKGNGKPTEPPAWGKPPPQTFTIPGGPTFEVRAAEPGDPVPPGGIRIPPGGSATIEVEMGAEFRDRLGGPPIEVSSRLRPDPTAIYFLAMTIRDCTEAIARIDAANDKRMADFEASQAKRHRQSSIISGVVMTICGALFFISLLSLTHVIWGWR